MSQKAYSDRIEIKEVLDKSDLASKSDEELMKDYQEGDRKAFEALFERYSGRVLGFLSKRLSQPQAAQELAQDVFLKLHRCREQYGAHLPFAPWLFSITRHVWIDHMKRNRREDPTDKAFMEQIPAIVESVAESPDEILDHLMPKQKTAVVMKIYDDATFDEIASRLETSPENARQLVSRGLRRLKEMVTGKNEKS